MSWNKKEGKYANKKPYNRGSSASKFNASGSLTIGIRGFLCTCNNKERECIRETVNLLNEYADLMFSTNQAAEKVEDEEDIADAVGREAKQCRIQEPRFRVVSSGARNCVFIATSLEDPVVIAHKILQDSLIKVRARYLLRLLPVSVTCKANVQDIAAAADPLLHQHFSPGNKTFAVVFKSRNNSSVSRTPIIELLANAVKMKNASNSTDLSSPQLVVLVEILRSVCCLAIVPEYFELAKYNLLEASQIKLGTLVENAETRKINVEKTEVQMEHSETEQISAKDLEPQQVEKQPVDTAVNVSHGPENLSDL